MITAYQETNAEYLITTEKDGARFSTSNEILSQMPLYVLKMHASMSDEEEWKKILFSKVNMQ